LSRIGILGGTFDPPHNGHIAIAKAAVKGLKLDKVIFIPAKIPPHKMRQAMASPADRANMLKLAIIGQSGFEISDLELQRQGPSFTADTLQELHQIYPNDELILLIGADNISEIETWHQPENIFALATLAAANRPGFAPDGKYNSQIIQFEMPPTDISSTEIRRRINTGLPITGLVPKLVEDYIIEYKLYVQSRVTN
jgi:nicotinate-nucleotide adenylyltransferase